jgi:glycosyltransferase involved in cell wall biosynthesis/protein-L-isoaspartate O-methyltransferase
MGADLTLSVIIPVFNERLTVRRLLEQIRAVPIRKEIIIVDDASTDGTTEVLREIAASTEDDPTNRLRLFFQSRNAGKGAAIRRAIPEVTGEIALIQDADLEYNPAEYPNLIEPIVAGYADVVYGSRFLGSPRRVLFFRHTIGNKFLTLLSNICTDLNLSDMETCYKVFRTDVLKRLHLVSNRFGIEPEVTAKVARLGCRIYEVPISYRGREYWEGKKISWRDGVAAVWTILKYSLVDDREDADPGYKTLQRMDRARRYNEWVWTRLASYVGDHVLEVGCGIGNFTRFLSNRTRVVATDNDEHYLSLVRNRFERFENIEVRHIDWEDPDLGGLRTECFDTILCLNVLEHIEADDGALSTFASLLQAGGRLVLQVPAMQRLYGEIDRNIGHFRRYDRDGLTAKLLAQGFEVEEASYFNIPGAITWYLNSRLLRRRSVPGLQVRLANWLAPWFHLERRLNPPFGMALIFIGRKVRQDHNAVEPFMIASEGFIHT